MSAELIRTLQPDVIKCLEEAHDFNTPVRQKEGLGHGQRFTGDLRFFLHAHMETYSKIQATCI